MLNSIVEKRKNFLLQRAKDTQLFYKSINKKLLENSDFRNRTQYFKYHQFRFYEVVSAVLNIHKIQFSRSNFNFIECSTNPVLIDLYRKHINVRTYYVGIDFPQLKGGAPPNQKLSNYANKIIEYDFNDHFLDVNLNLPKKLPYENTIILASEIIEHLCIDIEDFMNLFKSKNLPNPYLLITTPNFLSKWRLNQILNGKNPQQRFNNYDRIKKGGQHIREFTAVELVESVRKLKSTLIYCSYSFAMPGPGKIWTTDEYLSGLNYYSNNSPENIINSMVELNGLFCLIRL